MKKYDDNLFKMGEITKILGVTRKSFWSMKIWDC